MYTGPIVSDIILLFFFGCLSDELGLLSRLLFVKKEEAAPRLTPGTKCHVGRGLVSVVVPAYNEGEGIQLTLTTIDELAQVRE